MQWRGPCHLEFAEEAGVPEERAASVDSDLLV